MIGYKVALQAGLCYNRTSVKYVAQAMLATPLSVTTRKERSYRMDSISLWEKRCTKCGEVKFLTEFPYQKHHKQQYEYLTQCKTCYKAIKDAQKEKRKLRVVTDIPKEKRCTYCGEIKPIKAFSTNRVTKDKHSYQCNYCRNHYRTIPKAFKSIERQAQPHTLTVRKVNLKRAYGMTIEQYEAMLEAQGGVCAVCHKPETAMNYQTGNISPLSVDHDHKTGKIRGLLCRACNNALGQLKDNPIIIESLLNYIRLHQEGDSICGF